MKNISTPGSGNGSSEHVRLGVLSYEHIIDFWKK
jgi:hypothetical protein